MKDSSLSVESILNKQDVNYHLEKFSPMQEFYVNGSTSFDSIEQFKESDLNEYLEMYWGEMLFVTHPVLNFITVYYHNGKMLFADAILINQFPLLKPIGSVVPKALSSEIETECYGSIGSSFLEDLFYQGYTTRYIQLDNDKILEGNYEIQSDDYCPDYLQARNSSNDFLNGSPCPENDNLSSKLWSKVKGACIGSEILRTSEDRILRCNRTRKGHQLEPHSDCNQSSYLAAIHYSVPSGRVQGRELEIAIQDPIDEYKRISSMMTHAQQLYVKRRYDIKPLRRIAIEDQLCIFINNYNPKFVHGHPYQLSDEPVYSMVTQLGHPEVPKNNKLNLMKKLSGMI